MPSAVSNKDDSTIPCIASRPQQPSPAAPHRPGCCCIKQGHIPNCSLRGRSIRATMAILTLWRRVLLQVCGFQQCRPTSVWKPVVRFSKSTLMLACPSILFRVFHAHLALWPIAFMCVTSSPSMGGVASSLHQAVGALHHLPGLALDLQRHRGQGPSGKTDSSYNVAPHHAQGSPLYYIENTAGKTPQQVWATNIDTQISRHSWRRTMVLYWPGRRMSGA